MPGKSFWIGLQVDDAYVLESNGVMQYELHRFFYADAQYILF